MGIEESLEQIVKTLGELNSKIDNLTELVKGNSVETSAKSSEPRSRSPSDVAFHQKHEVSTDTGGRPQCPKCNSFKISEKEDRTKVLTYSGGVPIYLKKKYCMKCGESW